MKTRRGLLGFALSVIIVASACGLSAPETPPEAEGGAPPAQEPQGQGEGAMLPVSINEGLASLNSYSMTITTDSVDSASQQRTVTTFIIAHDAQADASYTRMQTRVTTLQEEVVSDDVQEQFVIGNQTCSVSGGEAQMSSISETTQVFSDLMSQVVVFNPLIENPVLVGEDVVNGVPVRTYSFDVRSLDAATDVETARADGSYAVAVDGDYLVHYRLDMDLRAPAEGSSEMQSTVFFIEISLEQINQPVSISFPANCQLMETGGG
jgi:hypothetical protein